MFGHDDLYNAIHSLDRRSDYLERELNRLQKKFDDLEEFLDIERKEYPAHSQYIKTTKCTKL